MIHGASCRTACAGPFLFCEPLAPAGLALGPPQAPRDANLYTHKGPTARKDHSGEGLGLGAKAEALRYQV